MIDRHLKSNKLQEQVYWYKADSHNNFKLGSKEFWDLSKDLKDNDDDDEPYDPNKMKKKNSGPRISVKKSKW